MAEHPWDKRPAFALAADVTVYWSAVRPCWEPSQEQPSAPADLATAQNAQASRSVARRLSIQEADDA